MRPWGLVIFAGAFAWYNPGAGQILTQPVPIVASPALQEPLNDRLDKLDNAILRAAQSPTRAAVASVEASLRNIKINPEAGALVVGNSLPAALTTLDADPVYRANYAKLAALHVRSTSQAPDIPQPLTVGIPQIAGGGTSSLRIVGNSASIRRPYVVRVLSQTNDYLCTGVLILPNVVLSALHCHCSDRGEIGKITYLDGDGNCRPEGVKKIVSLLSSDQSNICKIDASGKSPYGRSPTPLEQKGRDVIVLWLQRELPIDSAPALYTIAKASQLSAAHVGLVSGFGETISGDPNSIVTRGWPLATTVALGGPLPCRDCASGEFPAGPTPIVGGTPGLRNDTCQGDSGGPLLLMDQRYVENALRSGNMSMDYLTSRVPVVLGGITSRSINPDGSCGAGGIYEPLDIPWIRERLEAERVFVTVNDTFVGY